MVLHLFCLINILYQFSTGALSIDHGEFEAGNRSYVIDDVQCDGDERQLLDCQHNTRPNCHVIGTEDAGVRCLEGCKC